jgi:sodium transport system ATP-binding protein
VIEVSELHKTYGRTVAVHSISFTAPNGQVTGLLGPNGAGKTTALRAIAGISRPNRGRALIDGHDPRRDARAVRSRLGVVPEDSGLYDHQTVREHLEYAGSLYEVAPIRLRPQVDELMGLLGLTTIADRRASTLSLGQRQRVAFARALVHAPANVILDEPTNRLDVLSVRLVRRVVRQLAGRGCAVVLSSHLMPEVATLCDRIVVLSRGTVVGTGSPVELMTRTGCQSLEDAFVALIGSEEGLD